MLITGGALFLGIIQTLAVLTVCLPPPGVIMSFRYTNQKSEF